MTCPVRTRVDRQPSTLVVQPLAAALNAARDERPHVLEENERAKALAEQKLANVIAAVEASAGEASVFQAIKDRETELRTLEAQRTTLNEPMADRLAVIRHGCGRSSRTQLRCWATCPSAPRRSFIDSEFASRSILCTTEALDAFFEPNVQGISSSLPSGSSPTSLLPSSRTLDQSVVGRLQWTFRRISSGLGGGGRRWRKAGQEEVPVARRERLVRSNLQEGSTSACSLSPTCRTSADGPCVSCVARTL